METILVLGIAFLIYKVVGKHVDEVYDRIRRKKSLQKRLDAAQSSLIEEMRRYRELTRIAEKHINLSNDKNWLLFQKDADINRLTKEVEYWKKRAEEAEECEKRLRDGVVPSAWQRTNDDDDPH